MNQRDISIDILKFIAVFLIINSHMDALYPKYKMLATGGAIGDVLFLFASGYTLFLSNRKLRFDNQSDLSIGNSMCNNWNFIL